MTWPSTGNRMVLVIDWGNSLVLVTSPTVTVDAQALHDFIEDAMASPVGELYEAIIQPEGKIEDPSNPGIFSQIIMVFNSPWQIQFWAGSGYTRIFGGKIVGGLADQPMKATGSAGDITVLESPVDGVTVATGGVLTEAGIAQAVWDHATAGTLIARELIIEKILRNELIVDPVLGTMTIMDDDNVTPFLAGPLWEDVAELVAYRGKGIAVRKRLT